MLHQKNEFSACLTIPYNELNTGHLQCNVIQRIYTEFDMLRNYWMDYRYIIKRMRSTEIVNQLTNTSIFITQTSNLQRLISFQHEKIQNNIASLVNLQF